MQFVITWRRNFAAMVVAMMAVNTTAVQADKRLPELSDAAASTAHSRLTEADQPAVAQQPTEQANDVRSEEIKLPVGDTELAGTLYIPNSSSPVPAVVFVHGAAVAVRSNGYRELANHFARKGVAALIYDKRGCGASGGDWTKANLSDLADDALAWVRFLHNRAEINPAQVGLWGLSQGASIIPLAAARAPDASFLIAVGASMDFEDAMRHFRANLYRRLGHPQSVLDIANKTELLRMDLSNKIRSGVLPIPSAWRDRFRFEFDLNHVHVWQQVRQPILAIYGELDRQVPVASSSARLKESVAKSGNQDFTLLIYPRASHSIGQTRSGELGEEWIGYDPNYLEDMTDWVLRHTTGKAAPTEPMQRGQPVKEAPTFSADHYDRLRWYGNAIVQMCLFLAFAIAFLCVGIVGLVGALRRTRSTGNQTDSNSNSKTSHWVARTAVALSLLNLAVLSGLVWLILGLQNAWEPAYPAILNKLPLLGSLSAGLTLVWLGRLICQSRTHSSHWCTTTGWTLFVVCSIAFLPYLYYWNALGVDLR